MAVLLTHCVVNSLATLNAQPDDVTGMLATVMHQLTMVTDDVAAISQKMDETVLTTAELQQTVARLTERINAIEERTAVEVSCCEHTSSQNFS